MSGEQNDVTRFDNWLKDDSDVAALVMRQWLEPVEGKDAVIFPPTYTLRDTEAGRRFDNGEHVPGVFKSPNGPHGYNIDQSDDGSNVCQIDSVGSQANRMEPIFKREKYKQLVPQVVIKAGNQEVHLLDAGHRAADAIVRFSNLSTELEEAFKAIRDNHSDAEKLAKIAPTSIVFGAWDSRATQVKLPRIVRSVIRAYNVKVLHRSAQYIPAIDYTAEDILSKEEHDQKSLSELGLSHAPAPWSHGGVLVAKEIRRDASLNLVALRSYGVNSNKDALPLRRYLLGLALVAFTAPQETCLREGCELIPDTKKPAEWRLVRNDGQREKYALSHPEALKFALAAADAFGVGKPREAVFDSKAAKKELSKSKEERKQSRQERNKKTQEKEAS